MSTIGDDVHSAEAAAASALKNAEAFIGHMAGKVKAGLTGGANSVMVPAIENALHNALISFLASPIPAEAKVASDLLSADLVAFLHSLEPFLAALAVHIMTAAPAAAPVVVPAAAVVA